MKIVMLSPSKLTPFDKNPRVNKDAVRKVADSITAHGFNQPVVVDQKNVICVGHTRWEAAKLLKLKKIPVFRKRMSRKTFLTYNLADNKTAEFSSWDTTKLMDMFNEIDASDWADTGFGDFDVSAMFDSFGEDSGKSEKTESDDTPMETPDQKEPEPIEPPEMAEPEPDKEDDLRMVQIFLNPELQKKFIKMVDVLQNDLGTSNFTDTIYCAIETLYDHTGEAK